MRALIVGGGISGAVAAIRLQMNYGTPPPLWGGRQVREGLRACFGKPHFPVWRKLHLSLLDRTDLTKLVWTGSQRLYRRSEIAEIADRHVALLEACVA